MDPKNLPALVITLTILVLFITVGIVGYNRRKNNRHNWIDNLFEGLIFTFLGAVPLAMLVGAWVSGEFGSTETPTTSSDYLLIFNGIPMNETAPICFGLVFIPVCLVYGIRILVRTIKRRRKGIKSYYEKPRRYK